MSKRKRTRTQTSSSSSAPEADAFWFDDAEADRVVAFFERVLTHPKGGSGKPNPFLLELWQKEYVRNLMGWKRAGSNLRKYRQTYLEMPRKNGKTTLAAGLLLYMLLVDRENGKEVYSAATTRDQAGLVFDIAAGMVANSPMLTKRCEILKSKKRIVTADGYFQSCSAEAGAIHGTSPHCVVFDELHLQKDREMWEAFHTGFGARTQPMFMAITTAGHDRSSVCWEQHEYSRNIIEGNITDDSFLPMLFGADPEDDWTAESTWEKANPCLDVSLQREYLRTECKQAQEIPGLENSFRRLHLNQWTEQESRLIPMADWDQCEHLDLDLSEHDGQPCFAGLDLSSTRDVTALVLLFPKGNGVDVFPWFWIPEDNISRRAAQDQRVIRNFAEQGFVEVTDGNEVDVMHIAQRVVDICAPFDVRKVGFDPWNAAGPTQRMKELGMPDSVLVKMPQGASTYNEAIKQLLSMIGSQRLRHNGNKVLRWMASNAAGIEDANGNLRFHKGKSGDKIDGMTALGMALALYIAEGPQSSAYMASGSGVVLF